MRPSRTWATRMSVFLVVTLLAGACWPFYSRSTGAPYDNFGEAQGRACTKNGNPWIHFVCEGHPPRELADSLNDPVVIGWLERLKWEQLSDKAYREPADGGAIKPYMRVQSIREPQRFKLAAHDGQAYVMARIIASPKGPKDRRYRIGGDPNSTLGDYFYLVVRDFIPNDQTPPSDPEEAGPSRPISRWTIYGVDRPQGEAPRLKQMSTGIVRWCAHPHNYLLKDREASFDYCKRTVRVNNFVASERLFDPPIWFTCGIGCCVADFI